MDRAFLGTVPVFSRLSDDQLDGLAPLLRRREFKQHETVYEFGDHGDEFYVVQIGHVDASCPDSKGRSVPLAQLGPGEFFGEIGVLDGGPRAETMRAATDVALVCMSRHDFMELLDRCPTAGAHIVAAQAGRLRELLDKGRNGHWL